MARIHTACKNCIWATYSGKTQTGCSINKIDAFEKIGVEIVPVLDEEREFYCIDGRICQFYRANNWLLTIDSNTSIEEKINKEVQIGVDILLLVEEGQIFEEIQSSLLSIEQSTIKPESIVILLQNTYFGKYPIDHVWIKSHISIPYSVEYIVPKTSIEQCINIGTRRSLIYYLVLLAGKKLEKSYLEKLNYLINKDMYPLLLDAPYENYNQLFVSKAFHNYVGGFGKKNPIDKALEIQDECDKYTFIIGYENGK